MSGNSKTVAVLMAAYRAEKYINQCIHSILAQNVPQGWRVDLRIGVDGCRATSDALKFPHYYSDQNVGAYIMRNSLISLGEADAYCFFDADDVMIQGFLTHLLAVLPDFGAVLPAKYICDEGLNVILFKLQTGGSTLFSHKILEKLGGFQSYRVAGDSDFLHRIELAGGKIIKIHEPLYYRRKIPDSLTQNKTTGYHSDFRRRCWQSMTEARETGVIKINPETVPLISVDKKINIYHGHIMSPPVYILIRTSNRPNFFTACMNSVREQTYPNIVTIVHTDNSNDTYVEGDIIIRGEPLSYDLGPAPYNLYCNRMLESIPDDAPGWFFFLDDDDMLASPDAITTLVKNAKRDRINVGRVERWEGQIFPKDWGSARSFQSECFLIHTDYKNLGRWWANRGGDHYYSRQITDKLPINWIDNLIIAKVQEGKGNGMRLDIGQAGGLPRPNDLVPVIYKEPVRIPTDCRGRPGEIRSIPYYRAKELQQRGKVVMLKQDTIATARV